MTQKLPNFSLRRGRPDDAFAILEVQRSAVQGITGAHYSQEITEDWGLVNIAPERVKQFELRIERGEEVIVVAVDFAGQVVGFGSIVPNNSELRALNVHAEHGRKGVGRAIVDQLEHLAREAGVKELRLDASLNAIPFYEAIGFTSLVRGEHRTPAGLTMACMRMSKVLD